MELRNPQVTVQMDRDKALTFGVTPQQVEDALYYSYGQRQISTIYTPNNEYGSLWNSSPASGFRPPTCPSCTFARPRERSSR